MKLCAICGERPAGSTHSPHFCQPCDDERREQITASLGSMLADLEKRAEKEKRP